MVQVHLRLPNIYKGDFLMSRKKLQVTIVGEMEIDTSWYDTETVAAIRKFEEKNWPQWFMSHIKSVKVSISTLKKEDKKSKNE